MSLSTVFIALVLVDFLETSFTSSSSEVGSASSLSSSLSGTDTTSLFLLAPLDLGSATSENNDNLKGH